MQPEARRAGNPGERDGGEDLPPPTGTLFFLTLYLAALAGMWGAMYWTLVGR